MRRIKLTFEYDGGNFHGLQRQENVPTIQGAIEQALKKITGETITIEAAGRTDAGVHALGMVCHFDTMHEGKLVVFKDGINRFTPPEISVTNAQQVENTFQARFNAKGRKYQFLIYNRREMCPMWIGRATHVIPSLDINAMIEATHYLIGKHDFSAFRASSCQAKNPVCEVKSLELTHTEDMITLNIHATRFLHNMVRIIAGTLIKVGKSELKPTDVLDILQAKKRIDAGVTIAPHGLYFIEPVYPPHKIIANC